MIDSCLLINICLFLIAFGLLHGALVVPIHGWGYGSWIGDSRLGANWNWDRYIGNIKCFNIIQIVHYLPTGAKYVDYYYMESFKEATWYKSPLNRRGKQIHDQY